MYIIAICAFILSVLFTYYIIKRSKKFGYDLHKREKIKVPEMGGLAILLSLFLTIPFINIKFIYSILLSGFIGIMDDLFSLSPKEKFLFLFISGFFTGLLFNNIYLAIILGVGFMIFSNLTNMLAGFNGLEIGLGVLVGIFMSILFYLDNNMVGFYSALTFSLSYLGFLIFNKYPAKIFPGDCGTLPIGAFLSFLAIFYKEYLFLILMIPYFLDATLKFLSAGVMSRDKHKPTVIGEDGKLYYTSGYLSLPRLILKFKPLKEYMLVLYIWIFEIVCGLLAIFIKVNLWIIQ